MKFAFSHFSDALETLNSVYPYVDEDREDVVLLTTLTLRTLLDEININAIRYFTTVMEHVHCDYNTTTQ